MRCGCFARIFRRASRTCPLLETVDAPLLKSEPEHPLLSTEPVQSTPLLDEQLSEAEPEEEKPTEVEASVLSVKAPVAKEAPKEEEKTGSPSAADRKLSNDKKSRNGAPFFRSFFRTVNADEPAAVWVRCEWRIDEGSERVEIAFRFEKWTEDMANKAKGNASTRQSLFRIRGRKAREDAETSDLIRAQHPSSTSLKDDSDEEAEATRPRERSVFCFGWGSAGVGDDEDEAITMTDAALVTEAPPGLVGLVNLGNTCFLNAALQCLRCTPGLATLVVPELSNGFEGVVRKPSLVGVLKGCTVPVQLARCCMRRVQNRSPSSSSLFAQRLHSEWDSAVTPRSNSLPTPLPYELGGRLEGETGLAGGSVLRLSSVPNLLLREGPSNTASNPVDSAAETTEDVKSKSSAVQDEIPAEDGKDDEDVKGQIDETHKERTEEMNTNIRHHSLSDSSFGPVKTRDYSKAKRSAEEASTESHNHQMSSSQTLPNKEITEGQEGERKDQKAESLTKEDESEIELSADFISAFQKLVLEVCLGDADNHRSPKDLYLQLKKLPQGEWFCDGGQHDCQEIIKVLLDAIHASYAEHPFEQEEEIVGRCISDVSSEFQDSLHAIELENLKANSMWRRYLSIDYSPITDVFAGQLQIVRSCQKCHCRSTTYEPFWDLSLSLSREKSSWFNPGRMPGSLDDLLRAFTAAEVLQGDEAPYCECCEQKSPATRRILMHRFPKVLVINIKRFKYTKDGREKLTANINFPVRSLRLQNFTSKEHQHQGITELYDLYAVSNHYGTLGGGHYVAYCKVKDTEGKEGWYCFNDKVVTKISEDSVVTPNAYILFYAKRQTSESISNE